MGGIERGGEPEGRETESIITLAEHQELEKKTKEWEREKKVHGQIHLPLLQSISGQKKYTITRQEEAKINGPPTSPLTSIHLQPIPPLSRFLSLSPFLSLSLSFTCPLSFFSLSLSPHPSFSPHTFAHPLPEKPHTFFFLMHIPSSPLLLLPPHTPCLCHMQ